MYFCENGGDFLSVYTLKEQSEEISMCTFNHYGSSIHSHKFLEILYIEDGCAVHNLNGNESVLKKGNYLIVDYGIKHKYQSMGDGNVKVINCIFIPSFIDASMKNCKSFNEITDNYLIKIKSAMLTKNPVQTVFEDHDSEIYNIFKEMLSEYSKKNVGYREIMRAQLVEIIVRTLRKILNEDKLTAEDEIISAVKGYVKNHYDETISLTEFSKKFNYSLSYLSIKFKKETGMNFNEYVQRYRVEQSMRMLKNSNKKICDVANAVGYSDLKHFTYIFKKITGLTPYRFRKG